MLLHSVILGALIACFLGAIWYILHTPHCRACKVRLEAVGEMVRPWGRSGMDAMFYYVCPECAWMTQRRHTITHLY
jgi:hypothetical protein